MKIAIARTGCVKLSNGVLLAQNNEVIVFDVKDILKINPTATMVIKSTVPVNWYRKVKR